MLSDADCATEEKAGKKNQCWELKCSRVAVSAVKSLFKGGITTLSEKKKSKLSAKLLVLINKKKGNGV